MNTNCQESNLCRRAIVAAAPGLSPYSMWVDAVQKVFALFNRSSVSLSTWTTRGRHRRVLDRFSDHTMKDIGLARVDSDRNWHRLL